MGERVRNWSDQSQVVGAGAKQVELQVIIIVASSLCRISSVLRRHQEIPVRREGGARLVGQ